VCDPEWVDVLARDLERIPRRNLRVPVAEFGALWIAAERRFAEDPLSWSLFGVVATCRWLAGAVVPTKDGQWRIPTAPVTRRGGTAYEELIEAECLAAEKLLFRRPVPTWVQNQPGWLPAVVATFAWAWRRTGPPPIEVREHIHG
jgi:hypothetical protein